MFDFSFVAKTYAMARSAVRGIVVLNQPFIPRVDYFDPMSIMEGRNPMSDASIIELEKVFPVTDLFALMQISGLVFAVIVILATLIGMLFVRKSEALAEKKEDIEHKLLITFLISSLVTILNVVTMFLDGVFR